MEGKQQELEVWDDVWMTLCELCAKHYAKQHVLGKRCWETLHSTGKPQGPEAQGAQLGPSSWLMSHLPGPDSLWVAFILEGSESARAEAPWTAWSKGQGPQPMLALGVLLASRVSLDPSYASPRFPALWSIRDLQAETGARDQELDILHPGSPWGEPSHSHLLLLTPLLPPPLSPSA